MYAQPASNKENIIALLDRRRRSREIRPSTVSMSPNEPANSVESVKLLLLHAKANFFMDDYCRTARCPPCMDNTKILPLRFSENEKSRFLREFYRLQTYCNIFGTPEEGPGCRWLGDTFEAEDMWDLFFGMMPPWEVEEFGCMWAYICRKYTRIFGELAPDMSRDSPRFKDKPRPTSPDCFELYPDCMYTNSSSAIVYLLSV